MLVDRHVFLLVRQATITIQAFVRGTLTRRHYRRVRVLSSDYVLIQTQRLSILMGGGNADVFYLARGRESRHAAPGQSARLDGEKDLHEVAGGRRVCAVLRTSQGGQKGTAETQD